MSRNVFSLLAVVGYLNLIAAFIGRSISLPFFVIGFTLVSIVSFFEPLALIPPPLSRFRLLSPPSESMSLVRLFGKIGGVFGLCVAFLVTIVSLISFIAK
jgi:hypothetical protein